MKTPRYTDSQIMTILKQAEAGTPVSQLCREHGMSSGTASGTAGSFIEQRGQRNGEQCFVL